jgi:putative membrane protein insertion efficiency factor
MKGLTLALLLICILQGSLHAGDWGPWEVPQQQSQPPATSKGPMQLAVRLFQKYISPVDGARCPMYPTCSAYSLQALHKHGPLLGTFLTVDRLFHEGDPLEQQRPINKWGYVRFHDPLENNDFWLTTGAQKRN